MKRIKSYKAFESLSDLNAIKSKIYMLELEFDRKI
jgi:hypothetical protein